MKIRNIVVSMCLATMWALPAHAQYKEMSKVETLARSNSEQQMLDGLSKHLGVPSDTLKQEMTANKLNFGQLYITHTVAKSANADFKSVLEDSKSKPWSIIIEERKVDKKKLDADIDVLEKSFKKK